MSFSSLGLIEPLLRAVSEKGYETPSPIQLEAIPAVLSGRDVMAAAQTGTGKTAGFTLPLLQILAEGKRPKPNSARALVLTPTRELAAQVEESVEHYGKYMNLKSTVVFGGVKINPQMQRLRGGVDILVATPGRLLDLYGQNAVKFSELEVLILDEADRMLDMGFIRDIRKIIGFLPKKRQNLMFSATFSEEIRGLTKGILFDPLQLSVSPPNAAANTVSQVVHPVDKSKKAALLSYLVGNNNWNQVLVFSRTKHGANRLAAGLIKDGINAAAIHGNKSQGARTRALADFKSGKVRVLVATDIAARGLDIVQLPHVVNVDLPNVPEDYVHRIGRTGRAGSEGEAVSLVSADEFKQLMAIEQVIGKKLKREEVDGFEPAHSVPASREPRAAPHKPRSKKPARNASNSAGENKRSGSKPVWKNKKPANRTNTTQRSGNRTAERSGNR